MIWHYAKGKPKDVIELEGRLNADELYRAPDAELVARMEVLLARPMPQGVRPPLPRVSEVFHVSADGRRARDRY
jgi:hypothetical protein